MDKKYDVVIIGSGLGGLMSGCILGKEGYKVCVLEKNKQVGGCLQTFSRDKCVLDTGVHYIGALDEGQNLHRYFKYAGIMDKLRLHRMDKDAFDIITFEGDKREYRYAQGYERFATSLIEQFPHEADGIRAYCRLMNEYCDKFPPYRLDPQAKYPENRDHYQTSARQVIHSLISDPTLRAVLAGNNLIYAGDANKTPFYIHALSVNSYIESAWRCINGGSQISKALVAEIRRHGGDIFKRKKVESFEFNGAEACAVLTDEGERVEAKYFISNLHPIATYDLVKTKHIRKASRNRMKSLTETISAFSVHLTFDRGVIPYFNSNYYHLRSKDAWQPTNYNQNTWPTHSMISMAKTKSDTHTDSISLLAYMRFDEVARWADSFNIVGQESERDADYQAFKEQKAQIAIKEIEKKFPKIRDKIKGIYTSTPLSFRDYMGSPTGSLYGIQKDYQDDMRTFVPARTRVKNILLTGQNLNVHGILGVTVSAALTCSKLLGSDYLLNKIAQS